jgi:hypothetical protein
MGSLRNLRCAPVLVACCVLLAADAAAAAPGVTPGPEATAQASASTPATAPRAAGSAPVQPDDPKPEDDESEDPMGWIGIGVKLGVGYVGSSRIEIDAPPVNGMQVDYSQVFETETRTGLQVSVPINLGGDAFGLMIEPYLNLNRVRAQGVYFGPTISIQTIDPLYVGFGFGLRAAYLKADHLDFGIDLGGRVPFHATYYMLNDLALVAELGIGYTATGLILKPEAGEKASDISFGGAFSWDFGMGVRFP